MHECVLGHFRSRLRPTQSRKAAQRWAPFTISIVGSSNLVWDHDPIVVSMLDAGNHRRMRFDSAF